MLDIKMIVIRRTPTLAFNRQSWPNFQVVSAFLKGWGGGGMVVLKHVVQKIWFFGPQKSILSKSLPPILILQFSSKFFPTA